MDKKKVGFLAALCMVVIIISFSLSKTYVDIKTENVGGVVTSIKSFWPFQRTAAPVTTPVPTKVTPQTGVSTFTGNTTGTPVYDVGKEPCPEDLYEYQQETQELVDSMWPLQSKIQVAQQAWYDAEPDSEAEKKAWETLVTLEKQMKTLKQTIKKRKAIEDECAKKAEAAAKVR